MALSRSAAMMEEAPGMSTMCALTTSTPISLTAAESTITNTAMSTKYEKNSRQRV